MSDDLDDLIFEVVDSADSLIEEIPPSSQKSRSKDDVTKKKPPPPKAQAKSKSRIAETKTKSPPAKVARIDDEINLEDMEFEIVDEVGDVEDSPKKSGRSKYSKGHHSVNKERTSDRKRNDKSRSNERHGGSGKRESSKSRSANSSHKSHSKSPRGDHKKPHESSKRSTTSNSRSHRVENEKSKTAHGKDLQNSAKSNGDTKSEKALVSSSKSSSTTNIDPLTSADKMVDPLFPMNATDSMNQLIAQVCDKLPPPGIFSIQPAEEDNPMNLNEVSHSSNIGKGLKISLGEVVADLQKNISGNIPAKSEQTIDKIIKLEPADKPSDNGTCSSSVTNETICSIGKEALPEITNYIQSLHNLQFDYKKYTCFFCLACRAMEPSTEIWEKHIAHDDHKKSVWLWRKCKELLKSAEKANSTANSQKQINTHTKFVAGADYVVEVHTGDQIAHYVCVLCRIVHKTMHEMLKHMTLFGHVDNYLEMCDPSLYRPPHLDNFNGDYYRMVNDEVKKNVMDLCRKKATQGGRGIVRIYKGEELLNWELEKEESLVNEQNKVKQAIKQLFDDNQTVYPLTYKKIPTSRSVANREYVRIMKQAKDEQIIGLQYMMEMWWPCRRVIPVYYCILCDQLVTKWKVHCTILKHCVLYMIKHYNSIYESILYESRDKENFRWALTKARSGILGLEGARARIQHVYQVLPYNDFVFTAVNAKIAKNIVQREKIVIGEPPRVEQNDAKEGEKGKRDGNNDNKQTEKKPKPSLKKQTNHEKQSQRKIGDTSSKRRSTQMKVKYSNVNSARYRKGGVAPKVANSVKRRTSATTVVRSVQSPRSVHKYTVTRRASVNSAIKGKPAGEVHSRPKIYYGTSKGPMLRMEAKKRAEHSERLRPDSSRPLDILRHGHNSPDMRYEDHANHVKDLSLLTSMPAPMDYDGLGPMNAAVPSMSIAELRGLQEMLKTPGIDVHMDRQITQQDVNMLRGRFGGELMDRLMTQVVNNINTEQVMAAQQHALMQQLHSFHNNAPPLPHEIVVAPFAPVIPGVHCPAVVPLPNNLPDTLANRAGWKI